MKVGSELSEEKTEGGLTEEIYGKDSGRRDKEETDTAD